MKLTVSILYETRVHTLRPTILVLNTIRASRIIN